MKYIERTIPGYVNREGKINEITEEGYRLICVYDDRFYFEECEKTDILTNESDAEFLLRVAKETCCVKGAGVNFKKQA